MERGRIGIWKIWEGGEGRFRSGRLESGKGEGEGGQMKDGEWGGGGEGRVGIWRVERGWFVSGKLERSRMSNVRVER